MATVSNPSLAEVSVDESSDLIDLFKLEAEYTHEYTSQISKERNPSRGARKIKVEKRWYRGDSLGHGAFGAVWVERDCNTPDAATAVRAVKEISKGYMKRLRLDYRREMLALAKLSKVHYVHQYPDEFVQFYGWFEDARTLYLIMEYLPHGDLSSFIERGIPEDETKLITIQLLEGLVIMHENSFTHRDLKPANIFVKSPSPHWLIKIGDFGVSKRVRENTALRTEIGTRGFLAPEVAIEGYEEYSSKVDLWSLGCVVFQSLTQTIPFPTIRSLETFCSGGAFPTEPLMAKKVTAEGMSFLKTLLVMDPKDRLTAEAALDAGWLQTSDHPFRSEMNTPQEELIEDQASPMITAEDRGSTICLQKSEVGGIKDTPIRRKTLDVTDTSNSVHKHHEDIRIQPQASAQDTERSTSKESRTMEQQDGLGYLHMHNQEPALPTQESKTPEILQTLPLILQKSKNRTSSQDLELDVDSTVRGPKNSVSQINDRTRDTVELSSSQDLSIASTNRKAISLQTQDDKKGRSQIALDPLKASERAIRDAKATQLLLENGFDIYAAEFNANMALLWAASKDQRGDMVRLLVRNGADVDVKDDWGWTAFHRAAAGGHEAVMQLLLEKGADIVAKDDWGRSALYFAAAMGHEAVVRLLFEKGADIAAKDDSGRPALHCAAEAGHEAVVWLLLEKGADATVEDRWGKTALYCSARMGNKAVVQLLTPLSSNS